MIRRNVLGRAQWWEGSDRYLFDRVRIDGADGIVHGVLSGSLKSGLVLEVSDAAQAAYGIEVASASFTKGADGTIIKDPPSFCLAAFVIDSEAIAQTTEHGRCINRRSDIQTGEHCHFTMESFGSAALSCPSFGLGSYTSGRFDDGWDSITVSAMHGSASFLSSCSNNGATRQCQTGYPHAYTAADGTVFDITFTSTTSLNWVFGSLAFPSDSATGWEMCLC